jgi:parallel beta-helix repeat protein
LIHEPLEGRLLLVAPTVLFTTPDLDDDPDITAGLSSIKVKYSATVVGGGDSANYDLRGPGPDDVFDTPDDDVISFTSVTYKGTTGTVKFAKPPAGDYRFQVSDTITNVAGEALDGDEDGSPGGDYERTFTIIPAAASKYTLTGFPSSTTVGAANDLTLTALDPYNNVATGYTGTATFTSSDVAASLPADYTFTLAAAGMKDFTITLNTIDSSAWIRATDADDGFFKSKTGIDVTEAAPAFEVTSYPSPTTAGVSNDFLVTAVDLLGNQIPNYTGTVTFTSTDPIAALPADYTFTLADGGDRTFSATFKTAALQSLTVTDVDTDGSGTQSDIDVLPTVLKRFDVSGYPSPTVVGVEHDFDVTAEDTYGNVVTAYTGTVTFTSSDPIAALPADYTFTAGDAGTKTFQATLFTTGQNRSITTTDTATGLFGRQSGIVVQTGAFRYSSTSNIIYVEAPVTATLSDIKAALPNAPVELVDVANAIWKLDADIRITVGGTLELHGTSVGGDVNELRLRSENTSDADAIVEIRADYGNIDIRSTEITSWDSAAGGPDTEYTTFQRAFVRARSKLDSDGVTPLESRMDIIDSEVHHLGYAGSEAYGVSYKVTGDPGPNFELFDLVDVYGDVIDSHLHHNYFGFYSFGSFGMQLTGNEVNDNVVYGLDPHDDSDSLVISDNVVHHNGRHGIICSKRCDTLIIRNNNSSNNGGNGIMLHRNANDSVVEDNQVLDNTDSGIALFDSHNNIIRDNTSSGNKHGIRFSVGAADNVIENNEFINNDERGVNFFKGSDAPSPGDDGRPKRNEFRGNTITGNGTYGLRVRDADENIFTDNTIGPNGNVRLRFERAVDNIFSDNAVPSNTILKLRGNSSIQTILHVCNQPGILIQADRYSTVVFCPSAASADAVGVNRDRQPLAANDRETEGPSDHLSPPAVVRADNTTNNHQRDRSALINVEDELETVLDYIAKDVVNVFL